MAKKIDDILDNIIEVPDPDVPEFHNLSDDQFLASEQMINRADEQPSS